jgi:hypothetical protein
MQIKMGVDGLTNCSDRFSLLLMQRRQDQINRGSRTFQRGRLQWRLPAPPLDPAMLKRYFRIRIAAHFSMFILAATTLAIAADAPRVLPAGRLPDDSRLGPLKTYNDYFPYTPSVSVEAWQQRADYVRRQILVATGLWPMPTKTPAHAVIHGRVDRDGYTVEKVYFESYPGFFVTGSLYRPKGKSGKLPGVLCPHGHWPNGRFNEDSVKNVRENIVNGAERFEVGGRYPLQSRCVTLCRMGCVVLHYDMVGYADSQQITEAIAHRIKARRPAMETAENWGFFSPQAELHLQSIMGLQTYNSIRVMDWFSELPDVDPKRIGVTGASGGGTQTMLIGALDPRPAVLFPAVMVSTAMQGGCTCENCTYLRIATGNVEFAAMAAPRPLGMTAADDWTKEMPTKGFPELQRQYTLLGAEKNVMLKPLLQFGHNYNYVSRSAMYRFMNDRLKLGLENPVLEEDYKPLSIAEMSVWDKDHPRPKGGDDFERSLLKWMTADAAKQIAALTPKDEKSSSGATVGLSNRAAGTAGQASTGAQSSMAEFRRVVGGAVAVMVGRELPAAGDVQWAPLRTADRGEYIETAALVRYRPEREELPVLMLKPKQSNKQCVIWADENGKTGLYAAGGLAPAVQKLLAAGTAVVGVDLLYQGEFLADGKPLSVARRVPKSREFAGFTFGYNRPLPAQRVADLLTLVAALRSMPEPAEKVQLFAAGKMAPLAALARAQAGAAIDRLALATDRFRFAALKAFDDPSFLPGAVKYGDLSAILALSAPHALHVAGESADDLAIVKAAYAASGKPAGLNLDADQPDTAALRAVEWLLEK